MRGTICALSQSGPRFPLPLLSQNRHSFKHGPLTFPSPNRFLPQTFRSLIFWTSLFVRHHVPPLQPFPFFFPLFVKLRSYLLVPLFPPLFFTRSLLIFLTVRLLRRPTSYSQTGPVLTLSPCADCRPTIVSHFSSRFLCIIPHPLTPFINLYAIHNPLHPWGNHDLPPPPFTLIGTCVFCGGRVTPQFFCGHRPLCTTSTYHPQPPLSLFPHVAFFWPFPRVPLFDRDPHQLTLYLFFRRVLPARLLCKRSSAFSSPNASIERALAPRLVYEFSCSGIFVILLPYLSIFLWPAQPSHHNRNLIFPAI